MIRQIVVPYFIHSFGWEDYVECYVDMDEHKQGQAVAINGRKYEIPSPDCLDKQAGHRILLITNSRFFSIVDFLETISALDSVECYIIPLIQLLESEAEESFTLRKLTSYPMIPKKIHYCWFGKKEMPEFLVYCMET